MLDTETYELAVAKYEELVADFKAAAENFLNALEAIGEVDILKGDEIEDAWDAYYAWVLAAKLSSFDYVLDVAGGHGPDYYYDILVNKTNEFNNIVADALEAWNADKFEGPVTIYSQGAIAKALKWFETYAVKDAEGAYIFDYVLSDDVTVDADTYAALLQAKADCDELVAKKNAETGKLELGIASLGNITLADGKNITLLEKMYDKWAQDIDETDPNFLPRLYKVDNYDDLVAARATWNALKAEIEAIHEAIEALAEMDVADDRDAYATAITAIDTAIETFKTNNGGDLEGQITEAEFAIINAAKLALAKYDALADLAELYETKKATTTDDAKLALLAIAYNQHVDAITAAESIEDVNSLSAIAGAQFDAVLA